MSVVYEGAVSTGEVGGARVHLVGMARALDREMGGQLTVLTPRFLGEAALAVELPDGGRQRHLPAGPPGLVGHATYELVKAAWIVGRRCRDIVRREPTVVVSRITPVGVAPLVTRAVGVRTVIEVNGVPDAEFASRGFGSIIVRAVRWMTTLQLRVARGVVAVTDGTADACTERTAAEVMRLENGVELDSISIDEAQARPGRPTTIAYSGAFAPWQDLATLVQALDILHRGDPDADWRLVLIGDGERRSEVERLAIDLRVDDRIEVTGWLDRSTAARRLLDARVAVVPLLPKYESGICGSPLKLFEYLAAGRSVVGSDVDGVVELHDYPIDVYRRGDADALAAAIEVASSKQLDPGELEQLRAQSSWRERSERLLGLLERVAGRGLRSQADESS